MVLPAPDMEDCCEKRRCTGGSNAGKAYSTCDPCQGQGDFDKEACDCVVNAPYFAEYAWYEFTHEFVRGLFNGCETWVTDYDGFRIVLGINRGRTGIEPQGMSWSLVPFATCNDGPCPTDGASNVDGYIVDANGVVNETPKPLDRALCSDERFRQLYFTTGVVTGYGNTLDEAACDAKAKEPKLNIYPDCS